MFNLKNYDIIDVASKIFLFHLLSTTLLISPLLQMEHRMYTSAAPEEKRSRIRYRKGIDIENAFIKEINIKLFKKIIFLGSVSVNSPLQKMQLTVMSLSSSEDDDLSTFRLFLLSCVFSFSILVFPSSWCQKVLSLSLVYPILPSKDPSSQYVYGDLINTLTLSPLLNAKL